MVLFLIRYNELGLKSPRVRSRFQKQMIKNIEHKFLIAGLDCFIDSEWGRVYLHTQDQAQGLKLLKSVFGISSVSPVINNSDTLEEITNAVIEYAGKLLKSGQSFALRTRRTGQHKYTSMDLAEQIGDAILNQFKNLNLTVNLTNPDVEIFIEVRMKNSYIFSESYPGPGGLPIGTQGKIISVFTDENSFIATWLMMKRGCRVYPVLFSSKSKDSEYLEKEANKQIVTLKSWAPNIKLNLIKINALSTGAPGNINLDDERFVSYINRVGAKGICFSVDLDGFSNGYSNLKPSIPIFYPLIGLDENKIRELRKKIIDL